MSIDLADVDLEIAIYLRRWSDVARTIRERVNRGSLTLPPQVLLALADKLDPEVRDQPGRRKAPGETDGRDRMLCRCFGIFRSQIGAPGGPLNLEDAKDQTCSTMGASRETLKKAASHFPDVVRRTEQEYREAMERMKDSCEKQHE